MSYTGPSAWSSGGPGRLDELEIRSELATISRRTYEAGLVAATDGNVSHRIVDHRVGEGGFLISPSGTCLGEIDSKDFVRVDAAGHPVSREGPRPSSEVAMHSVIYEVRPDVTAILHAHPPVTLGFSIAGVSLAECVLPEVVVGLGSIPTLDYATPTTDATADVVRQMIPRRDALILDRHGTVTVGKTITEAFHKLDKVEHTAKITLVARQLGNVRPLPPAEVEKLLRMREEMGLPPIVPGCSNCGLDCFQMGR